MFERFTGNARQVVIGAQAEVYERGAGRIRSEHLLAALYRPPGALARTLLAGFDVDPDAVLAAVGGVAGPPGEAPAPRGQSIPFGPDTKATLENALREAVRLGHEHIGTEHFVLGLLRTEDGAAHRILTGLGVALDPARTAAADLVRARLAG